jgi:hypothetical protein
MLLTCPTPMLFNNLDLLSEKAVQLRIPFTSFVVDSLSMGVLFAYGPSFAEGYRKAATYVDKILKGAKPGDLPIEHAPVGSAVRARHVHGRRSDISTRPSSSVWWSSRRSSSGVRMIVTRFPTTLPMVAES